jgi:hypothetical protein
MKLLIEISDETFLKITDMLFGETYKSMGANTIEELLECLIAFFDEMGS